MIRLNNRLYKINIWLDKNELFKFFIMLFVVGFSMISLQFGNPVYGVIPILIVVLFTLVRMRFQTGDWGFKKDIYNLPEVGEIFVIEKEFFWDGSFLKVPPHGPGAKPNHWYIRVGSEWSVVGLKYEYGDWEIDLRSNMKERIHIKYFESRKYWKTKSEIRDEKLRGIGIR